MSRGSQGAVLIPVAVAVWIGVALGWPDSMGAWYGWLGRVAGAAGLACMLVSGLLSFRIPGLDRPFGGLVEMWILHHRLGLAAFVLVLLHPPLMALAALPAGHGVMAQVLVPPAGDWAMWLGWLALVAMMVFLAPSFQLFGQPDYQRWKGIHFLSGIALLGGLVHTVALTRSVAPPWELVLWGGLGGLALVVFIWRATVARTLLRRDYEIRDCVPLASGVVELSLKALGKPIAEYQAGQFVYLTPLDLQLEAGCKEEHPYTISSAPGEDSLRIAIKDLGDASGALQRVQVPSRARVEGPYGDFFPERLRARPQLWIGGGIGISPFVSAARAIRRNDSWGDTQLLYCANDPSRAYFLDELREIAGEQAGFRVDVHYFVDEGSLTRAFIENHYADAAQRDWYVCGPLPLIRIVCSIGRELGVPRRRIHTEEFSFL